MDAVYECNWETAWETTGHLDKAALRSAKDSWGTVDTVPFSGFGKLWRKEIWNYDFEGISIPFDASWYDNPVRTTLKRYNSPDYSGVVERTGSIIPTRKWLGSYWERLNYNEAAIVVGPISIPDTTAEPDLDRLLWHPEYHRLRGIAITAGATLELYAGKNYTDHLATWTGPGVWNTKLWNGGREDEFSEYGIRCCWTGAISEYMGSYNWIPQTVGGHTWTKRFREQPKILSLKIYRSG